MNTKIVGIILILGMSIASVAYAEMSSTNFIIRADSIDTGGDNTSSSASYILRDSVTQTAAGNSSSSSYNLRSGFRPEVFDQIVTLDVAVQNTSESTDVSSLSSTDITVDSVGYFSVGDLVVLVQDVTSTHLAAVGKITGIAANVITVDSLTSSGSPSIDGSDDVLYRASASSLAYSTLSLTAITHRVVVWEVDSDIQNGFNIYVSEDGNLRNDATDIDDVSDGSVTAGSEEHGARSSDTSLANSTFDTEDTAITTAPQQVGSVTGTAFDSKGLLDIKVAADSFSASGSYANNLYIIAAPTY